MGAWLAAVLAEGLLLRWAAAALVVLCLPLAAAVPNWTVSTGSLRVTLLQGNISQSNKFDAPTVEQALRWYASQIAAAQGALGGDRAEFRR
jgi:apolipoprotein N-acyltransferase